MSTETKTPPPAVSIKNLDKVFRGRWGGGPVHAVRNLSLEVQPGEVYGLIGPNGSGKSTTMKVLLGLIAPTAGETAIFGIDSSRVESRREVGFLPENPYLYRHLTGLETLKFYANLCEVPKKTFASRADELLELVGLTGAKDRRLAGYSKGMLQRIGLAQALIHDPKLVVLDEPTAGVDQAGSRQIRNLVFELKRRGITVILSSHLLEQVQEVCDRVGIIFNGDMVREGNLEDLISVSGQTELILEGVSDSFVNQMVKEVEGEGGKVLRNGRPRTTLEQLFLEATGGVSKDASKGE